MAVKKNDVNRLENEGKDYRKNSIPGKNRYSVELSEYDESHEDAKSHDDAEHPWGKGTGKALGYAVRNLSAPKTQIDYSNVDTKNGGGSYDKFGTKGVSKAFQGDSGRNFLEKINIYGPDKAYGKESVNIDEKIKGQYINYNK